MFEKLLTTIGFGNAKVDTLVGKTTFTPEERVAGIVRLENLEENDIERIELSLIERKENTDATSDFHTIDALVSKIVLHNDGTGAIPFIFDALEIEDYDNEFIIMTHVFVNNAVDYYDEDQIYFEVKRTS